VPARSIIEVDEIFRVDTSATIHACINSVTHSGIDSDFLAITIVEGAYCQEVIT
jgi:hypothetical protein